MALFSDFVTFKDKWPPMMGIPRIWEYFQAQGASHVGQIRVEKVVIGHAALATAGTPAIFTPAAGEEWALRDLKIGPGALTSFSAGGNRLIAIQSGSNIYSVIPNASIETLVAAAWGATALPFPATPAHGDATITAAAPLVAAYSGGTTDHDAGSITIQAVLERVT